MPSVRVLAGPPQSGRPAAIAQAMREHWDRALLLTPTRAHALRLQEKFLQDNALSGIWGAKIQAFDDFAQEIIHHEGQPARRIPPLEQRLLIEECLEQLAREEKRFTSLEALITRPGFAAHLLRLIARLKQAGAEPKDFLEGLERRGAPSPIELVAAHAYARYQARLQETARYDIPGLYWQAALICQQTRPRRLEGIGVLLLDGFDDFTPSEFRVLAAAAPHLDACLLGLNLDPAPEREALYFLPAQAAGRLEAELGARIETFTPPAPETWREFAAANIFGQPVEPPPDLRMDLRVTAYASAMHEAEDIARQIKSLILDKGVSPDEIAIVYPALHGIAATLQDIFDEFGLPLHPLQPPPLARSGAAAFLLRWLDAINGWEREAVLDVLRDPRFGALPAGPRRALYPAIARAAQVVRGLGSWRERLEKFAARANTRTDSRDLAALQRRTGNLQPIIRAMLGDLDRMAQTAALLPETATPAAFAEALDQALDALGLEDAINRTPGDPQRAAAETAAMDVLRAILDTLAAGGAQHPLSLEDFAPRLRRAMLESTYAPPNPSPAVRLLDLPAIRNLAFSHVFFAGLNEGALPRRPETNAILPERELARLREGGLGIGGKREHTAREQLLFQQVLAVPAASLQLSWRLSDAQGREAAVSPYLAGLRELLDAAGAPSFEDPLPAAAAFLPSLEQAASLRDLRNAWIHASPLDAPAPEFQDALAPVLRGIGIESSRHDPKPFGPHDGVIQPGPLRDAIAELFGPDRRFSASQLEAYVQCPFQFFMKYLLKIEVPEQLEDALSPLLQGDIIHQTLCRFHRAHKGRPAADIPLEDAREDLRNALHAVFEESRPRIAALPEGLLRLERARIEARLERYLQHARAEGGGWRPEHFEAAFGLDHPEPAETLHVEEPFLLDLPESPIKLGGRIDRIDLQEDGAAARIIDYKTGALPAPRDIAEGIDLQLTLYAQALEECLLPGVHCAEARYLPVGKPKHIDALQPRRSDKPEEIRAAAHAQIARALDGIREGRFPPLRRDPKRRCWDCGIANVCRYEAPRIQRKAAASGWNLPAHHTDAEAPE